MWTPIWAHKTLDFHNNIKLCLYIGWARNKLDFIWNYVLLILVVQLFGLRIVIFEF